MHPIPLSDPRLFTDSDDGQLFIERDPLKLTHATARFLFESSRYDAALRKIGPNRCKAPTTLVLAGRDKIIRNLPTERWARRVFGPKLNTVLFSESEHTLEFGADVATFSKLLVDWSVALSRQDNS